MAFRKDKTTAAQTSGNVAGTVVSALIAQGIVSDVDEAAQAVEVIFDRVFEQLAPVVDEDNALFAEVEQSEPKPQRRSSGGSKGGGSRGRGGQRSRGGRDSGRMTLDEAFDTEMSFGAFKGLTLGEIFNLSREESEEYGYEKGGRAYLRWLADNERAPKMARAASLIIDNARQGGFDDEELEGDE